MSAIISNVVEHEVGPTGLVAIRLHSSAVRLRGVDGRSVRVTGPGGALERSVRIERGPGSLSIQAIRADRSFSIGVASIDIVAGRAAPDLDVEVPREATVVIETAGGDIAVVGLSGDQRYRTTSGEIELHDVSGQLAVDGVSGDVAVLTAGPCSVAARTVSGDLRIRGEHDLAAGRIATTSGDVRLEGRFSGPFSIETVSGDMILAPHGGVRLEVQTVTGDVRSDLASAAEGGRGARTVVVGGGGATVTIRSISGDVHVVEPSPAGRPPLPAPIATPPIALEPPTTPDPPMPPSPPEPPSPPNPSGAPEPPPLEGRSSMAILEALERGDIDVDEASRRLEALDDTNPEPEA